jgi:hypothetical protein
MAWSLVPLLARSQIQIQVFFVDLTCAKIDPQELSTIAGHSRISQQTRFCTIKSLSIRLNCQGISTPKDLLKPPLYVALRQSSFCPAYLMKSYGKRGRSQEQSNTLSKRKLAAATFPCSCRSWPSTGKSALLRDISCGQPAESMLAAADRISKDFSVADVS